MSDRTVYVSQGGGGIGLCGLLFCIFLTLKLCGVIAWPWIWVCAPLWIPFAILGVVLILAACIAVLFLAAVCVVWLIGYFSSGGKKKSGGGVARAFSCKV
jgi:hypothetical protein